MKRSFKAGNILRATAAVAAMAILSFAGCTKVDDTLGGNLIPDNEQMNAAHSVLGARLKDGSLNPKQYVETRLYQTDSVISSNISYGYFGSMLSDTFGLRNIGFLSQYLSYFVAEEGAFGYRPIFDSAQIVLSINSFGGDTTIKQLFNVYEIPSNNYIYNKPIAEGKTVRDTTFYLNFDPVAQGVVGDLLFTFSLGGDAGGPASLATTMTPTQAGRDFVSRLMLLSGKYQGDYSIYDPKNRDKWVEEFKGFYICPAQNATNKGAIYATDLNLSGFTVYGRNRDEQDPTLIKDTLDMAYYFYASNAEAGNVSVNSIARDYSKATSPEKFNIADAVETNDNRPTNTRVYVEGMGGVISEITFTKEFFSELEQIIAAENAKSNKGFKSLAFSQAKMSIYFSDSNYDWQKLGNVNALIEQMNAAHPRLGLYNSYKGITAVPDYLYQYEKTYDEKLPYSGYINRSRGCYTMFITAYIQTLWNNYQKEVKAAAEEHRAVDLDKVKNRSIYLGPEAYSLYSTPYSVAQGMTPDPLTEAQAPINLELTYNFIK